MIGARVLIVDNDQERRQVIHQLAVGVGFEKDEIVEADTADGAMRAINEMAFAVCVCNLHLAQPCEGLRVMVLVRQKWTCKVICISADDDQHGWICTEMLGPKVKAREYVNLNWEPVHWQVLVKHSLRKWRLTATRKFAQAVVEFQRMED